MRPELSPMVTRSPGFTDLSASRMMPLMKLATIFCRPMPMPTPAAPEKMASAEGLMPTPPRPTPPAKETQRKPGGLEEQHLDRWRQIGGAGDPAFDEIGGEIGQPQRHDQQHAEL